MISHSDKLFPSHLLSYLALAVSLARAEPTQVLLVLGAPGTEEYGSAFSKQAASWREAAAKGGAAVLEIGTQPETASGDRALLEQLIANSIKDESTMLWLVLLGHGTWDGKQAHFNLRGPDLSAEDLSGWLKPLKRPAVVINASSSSGPFLGKLAAPNRSVITATKSGVEQNYCRFGEYLAKSWADPAADLDQDGQTSLLEAFLAASHGVAEFYKTEGRLATEHALIDDNGDGLGTPADWFRGVRAVRKPNDQAQIDGVRSRQIQLIPSAEEQALSAEVKKQRDALERQIAALREAKTSMKEADYFTQLEKLLVQLAELYGKEAP